MVWYVYISIAAMIIGLVNWNSNPLAALVAFILSVLFSAIAVKEKASASKSSKARRSKGLQGRKDAVQAKAFPNPAERTVIEANPVRADSAPAVASEEISSPEGLTQPLPQGFANKTYKVTGISHYLDNLMAIAIPNSDYNMTKREIIDCGMTDEYIWEHQFYPSKLELQPEPNNPHAPNAIKVLLDDKLVGYIKSGSCKHLLNVMDQDRFMGATCKVGGGKYKRVDEEYDDERDKTVYTMDKGDRNYSITLTVKEKNK